MNEKAWSDLEKITIVMEFMETDIGINRLCKKHGVTGREVYLWMLDFLGRPNVPQSTHVITNSKSESPERKEPPQSEQ